MRTAQYPAGNAKMQTIPVFGGLNRYPYRQKNEFLAMKNLSTDAYPYITPRKPRKADEVFNRIYETAENGSETVRSVSGARAVIAPREEDTAEGFCGVEGTSFYYNGRKKEMQIAAAYDEAGKLQYGQAIAADGKIQLIWMNHYLLIHGYDSAGREPYLYYYNTRGEEDLVQSPEYDHPSYFGNYKATLNDKTGTGSISVLHKKPYKKPGNYWNFRVGDSIFIDGLSVRRESRYEQLGEDEIYDMTVTEIRDEAGSTSGGETFWTSTITFSCVNQAGENPISYSNDYQVRHIYRRVPPMSAVCVKDGRIWGANPNGETIYASAFGDEFYFSAFAGTNADSVALETATQGGFLGVYEYDGTILAMKKNGIEVVYGSLPKEYAVGKSLFGCGCADMDSVVTVEDCVFYLGYRGFFCYRGGRPQLISEPLATEYRRACAVTDGVRYWVSAERTDGSTEFLCYDRRYGIWLLEDDLKIIGGFFHGQKLYLAEAGEQLLCLGGTETVSWSLTLAPLSESKEQGAFAVRVFGTLPSGTKLFAKADSGAWEESTLGSDAEGEVFYLPIRCRNGTTQTLRLEGSGDAMIRKIEIDYDLAGRRYR